VVARIVRAYEQAEEAAQAAPDAQPHR